MRHSLAYLIAILSLGWLALAVGADDDLAKLSDEFDNPKTLTQWQQVWQVEGWGANHLERCAMDGSEAGQLVLMPYTSTWYKDWRGALLFKTVTGNFVATAKIQVKSRKTEGAPRASYSLAGVMARAPRAITPETWKEGQENWLFCNLGSADKPGTFQFELKTTQNSNSNLEIKAAPSSKALLQVVRIGPHFLLMVKPDGEAWQVMRRLHRPDLPNTLQVGMVCYTDWPGANKTAPLEHNRSVNTGANPDLVALVDYFHYRRPPALPAPAERAWSNPEAVSDEAIISIFATPPQ
jgi:hypothetical protein